MELKDLMAAFGKTCGVEGLVPDDEGVVTLGVDDMAIVFREFPEQGKIVTYAEIADEPPENVGDLAMAMLAANHLFQGTGGATISADAEKKKFYLNRCDDAMGLDPDSFCAMVEKFVNVLETWRRIVADYRPGVSSDGDVPGSASADEVSRLGGLGGGFMQV